CLSGLLGFEHANVRAIIPKGQLNQPNITRKGLSSQLAKSNRLLEGTIIDSSNAAVKITDTINTITSKKGGSYLRYTCLLMNKAAFIPANVQTSHITSNVTINVHPSCW
ncbi:hypothetical protein, partial [Colwellia sp. MB02u-14]|uniref:hypothetical protein n=1 Tax=Colwellia sp. MB02u-14 TaxID=2759815 RepID=UPI001C7161E4